jgi:hypothetical protein
MRYSGLLLFMVAMYSICCVEQEFIKPKIKKVYVTEQQDIELDGEIAMRVSDVQGVVADILKAIFLIGKNCLDRVYDRVNGEKDGLHKRERTERYEKKVKIKEELEKSIVELQKLLQRLNDLM